MMVTTTIP